MTNQDKGAEVVPKLMTAQEREFFLRYYYDTGSMGAMAQAALRHIAALEDALKEEQQLTAEIAGDLAQVSLENERLKAEIEKLKLQEKLEMPHAE